jgi:hypothetical protein
MGGAAMAALIKYINTSAAETRCRDLIKVELEMRFALLEFT